MDNPPVNSSLLALHSTMSREIKDAFAIDMEKMKQSIRADMGFQMPNFGDTSTAPVIPALPQRFPFTSDMPSSPMITPPAPISFGRLFNEDNLDSSKVRVGQGLPKLIIPGAAVSPEGFLAYSTSTKQLYYSDGQQWNEVTGSATFTNLTVTNHLTVGNLATLNNVTVSGSATMNSLGVTNGITSGSLSVTNGATLGNLTVSGTSSLNSASVTNGLTAGSLSSTTLAVTNGATLGNLTVSGTSSLNSASVTNGLTAGSLTSNTLTATNTLSVTNGATVGSLTVNNGETISGGLTVDTLTVTSMRVVTGVTNVLSTDSLLLCNTSGGGITLNLPAGTKGQSFVISDIGRAYGANGSSTNNITLVPNGTDIFLGNNGSTSSGNYTFGLNGAQFKLTYVPSAVSSLGAGAWLIKPEVGSAPFNLTVFVSTGGSDNNDGLTLGTAVATLQQGMNVAAAIGWDNTCTISVGSGTFNTPNLTIPRPVYGKQAFPMCVQGALTTVYSGTINTITNTYTGAAVADQTNTISYNVTVGASSGNGVLRGDFLRVTSSNGTANQIGFLINDNTNTGLTTETYVMCSYPSVGDLVSGTQPAAAANDTFTVFTRGTILNFNDATRAQIINIGGTTWFRDINFTISANTSLIMQFMTGTFLFTNTGFSCNSTTNNYRFERFTRLCTGRDIILLNPSPSLGSIDVAGIYCAPTVVTSMSITLLSGQNNIDASVFRQASLIVGPGTTSYATVNVLNSQFPDGRLVCNTASLFGGTLLFTVSASFPFSASASVNLNQSSSTIVTMYCTATAAPATTTGIACNQAIASFSNVSVTGYTGNGAFANSGVFTIASGNNFFNSNGLNGLGFFNASSVNIFGTLTCNSNSSAGFSIQGGGIAAITVSTLTCNSNGTNGFNIQSGAQVSVQSTNPGNCTSNSSNQILINNAAQVFLSNINTTGTNTSGHGLSIVGSAQVTLVGTCSFNSNTAANVDGINALGAIISISGATTCNSNNRHGMAFDNCVVFINATCTLNLNNVDGIKCVNGTRLDANATLQTTGGAGNNNTSYGLECQGASCFVNANNNTVLGNTAAVKVGVNAGVTWATINAGAAANTSDLASGSTTYSIVRNRLLF